MFLSRGGIAPLATRASGAMSNTSRVRKVGASRSSGKALEESTVGIDRHTGVRGDAREGEAPLPAVETDPGPFAVAPPLELEFDRESEARGVLPLDLPDRHLEVTRLVR